MPRRMAVVPSMACALPVRRQAFVEQILPGLAGGVVSAITFYPLELYETALQASCPPVPAKPSHQAPHVARHVRVPHRNTASPNQTAAPPGTCAEEAAAAAALSSNTRNNLGHFFRGADMATASAIFGFGAFFTTFAGLDALFPCQEMYALLLKNTLAAGMCQLVNSPFQLLKTSAVVSGTTSLQAFSSITSGGKDVRRLWMGVEANLLCVTLIACKFTIFKMFIHEVFSGGATPLESGVVGGAACLAAGLLTYPCIALKTVVMAGESKDRKAEQSLGASASVACGVLAAAALLYQRGRLYAGITPFLLRSVPPAALLFSIQRFFELNS
jgi:hypothetical protein